MANSNIYDKLEEAIGYQFKDRALLIQSLTPPSYSLQHPDEPHNQRMEFLGDAIIGFIFAEHLFASAPGEREGYLSRARAALAQGTTLSEIAHGFKLEDYIRLPRAEFRHHGGAGEGMVEDALEALVAAIYFDSDLECARKAVLSWYGDIDARLEVLLAALNPKGRLQEWFQAEHAELPIYEISRVSGPDHAKEFTAGVYMDGKCLGSGSGRTKKDAEEHAAEVALKMLEKG